jgi:hypothetical protein
MPDVKIGEYNLLLENVANQLDISPGKYQQAVDRYTVVGEWLCKGTYEGCFDEPEVYPQGSFNLGTVVRPIIDGAEGDYDIDLVFEVKKNQTQTSPREIKNFAGDRLKKHGRYKNMLKDEGRRCWTLQYAEEDGVGFHLDILPSIPRHVMQTAISITHKSSPGSYDWCSSNPRGYAQWFKNQNEAAFSSVEFSQKEIILESHADIFASVDDVPSQLVKTPLQRAIQILKRHRDLRFFKHPSANAKPISMIITTLAAQLYENEQTTYEALKNIVTLLDAHANLINPGFVLESSLASRSLITRKADGKWWIPNPVDPEENFADRWHENNHERARAFFQWVSWVRTDLVEIVNSYGIDEIYESVKPVLGERNVKLAAEALPFITVPAVITATDDYPAVEIKAPAKPWSTKGEN